MISENQDPRENLSMALDEIDIPKSRVRAFLELSYTASEGGLIPFNMREDGAEELLKLAFMAASFEDSGVPDNLRM